MTAKILASAVLVVAGISTLVFLVYMALAAVVGTTEVGKWLLGLFGRVARFLGRVMLRTSSTSPTIADHIRQLGDLQDQGLLTQAEFETKKAELLERM